MDKKEYQIAVLPGDGIGPEVTAQAIKILKILESKLDISLNLKEYLVGELGTTRLDILYLKKLYPQ